jgi:NAD(P)-dependent dehydrogenase (short-subunit alcohol dehydrogenase family)
MVSLAEIRASNAQIIETNAPRTAVFVGGTAGIGKAALSALVFKKTPIKVYIIGRGQANHKSFVEDLQQSNPKAEIIWLEGQVTLLAEVKRLCKEIKSREDSIDLLFLSAGFLPFAGRHGIYDPLTVPDGNS